MSTLNITKKPAEQLALQDWHTADIKAAIEKAGWTLRQLSIAHGYGPTALKNALHAPWPKAEAIVADAIGVAPHVIWPTRYRLDGSPRSGRGERGTGQNKPELALVKADVKSNTPPVARNVNCAAGG
ncbi:helix-turn-helix domain-containing protein [Ralstonia pseudosolanacearum]